ncbi:MAG: MAPEG family protein [Sphingopyxis sp.]
MPVLTLFFAAAAALVNAWLGIRCGQVRIKEKISHGDGGNMLLQRRMRAQLNFAENTPGILILFLALELAGFSALMLEIVAVAYVIARICHGLGMDAETDSKLRGVGVMVSMLTVLVLSISAIYVGYSLLGTGDLSTSLPTTI